MSGIKDVMKGGWHPKGKDGGKESWRGDFKGLNQVAGWMGKGKDGTKEEASEHRSAPLSSLKDPDSFGPPPKRVLGVTGTPSSATTSTSGGGLGSALSPAQIRAQEAREEEERRATQAEQEKPPPPAVPFRADTTGLSTSGLLPPPKRNGTTAPTSGSSSAVAKPKPNLPPRLPPREVAAPPAVPITSTAASSNAASQGVATPLINQSAATRLGKAGISVPGFGIGKSDSNSSQSPSHPASQLSELQSRFSRFNTSSTTPSTTTAEPSAPTGGTTWAQKRAALQTAQNFNKDPSSVSLSDARAAASTANDFHRRHGEQVGQGLRAAQGVNERFGVADKIGRFSGGESATGLAGNPLVGGKKVAPPPPPAKKKELSELGAGAAGVAGSGVLPPPPLPMGSKPRMGG